MPQTFQTVSRILKSNLNRYVKEIRKTLAVIREFLAGKENEKQGDELTAKIQKHIMVGVSKIEGLTGVHPTIDWLLRKFDIPHRKYGVWMNGIEYTSLP